MPCATIQISAIEACCFSIATIETCCHPNTSYETCRCSNWSQMRHSSRRLLVLRQIVYSTNNRYLTTTKEAVNQQFATSIDRHHAYPVQKGQMSSAGLLPLFVQGVKDGFQDLNEITTLWLAKGVVPSPQLSQVATSGNAWSSNSWRVVTRCI